MPAIICTPTAYWSVIQSIKYGLVPSRRPHSPFQQSHVTTFTITHDVCPYSLKSWKEYKGTFASLTECESACIASNCSVFTWNHVVKPKQCWGYSGSHPTWAMRPNPHCDSGCLKSRVPGCGAPPPPPQPPPPPPGPLPPDFPRYVGPVRPKVSINASAGARSQISGDAIYARKCHFRVRPLAVVLCLTAWLIAAAFMCGCFLDICFRASVVTPACCLLTAALCTSVICRFAPNTER